MGFHSKRSRRRKKNKKQKQPGKGNFLGYLPMDISMDILKRLPLTSLTCFKLVSKVCYNLATNVLASRYRLHQENSYCLIINPDIYEYPFYLVDNGVIARRIDRPKIPRRYYSGEILSSNGLLCLLFYYNIGKCLTYYRVCLYNPLTNEHDFLPDPEITVCHKSDNNKSRAHGEHKFGFGFNTSTNEYKVVRFVRTYVTGTGLYEMQAAHVFTLGKKGCQWSVINNPVLFPDASSNIVVGNAIHWLCEDDEEEFFGLQVILSFDLFEEKFHRIPNPDGEMKHCNLSILAGCLVAAYCVYDRLVDEADVWVLKEYGVKESWTKEFVIRNFPTPTFTNIQPLFCLKSGKIGILFDDKAIYYYDPNEETFEIIHPRGIIQEDEFLTAIYHTPTLISPLFLKCHFL